MLDSMISIDTYGLKPVRLQLNKIELAGKNLEPFFQKTGSRIVDRSVAANFKAQGRPPWKALKPATIRQKQRLGYGGKGILVRTGKLMASASKKGDPDHVVDIKPLEMHVYSKLKVGDYFLAEIHQKGMGRNSERPIWLLREMEIRKMVSGIRRHVISGGGYELGFRS